MRSIGMDVHRSFGQVAILDDGKFTQKRRIELEHDTARSAGEYRAKLEKLSNLTVLRLSSDDMQALAGLASRSMALQCTIQDGTVWLGGAAGDLEITPRVLQAAVLS